ncbi:hypothetical protein [Sphingomonas hengshuiensis]|uniref:Lipoprotein n=1 Tax=Sphingomonas hengshuiensis TaxID=1609977 RepID=A0A7U4JAR7_9SPHN|nr:hypothetical protein [Sphingomonas hengshuiensis]AJP73386.1 hypothetical protein TS85_18675 [Sphingomonas hengshuiensis]
MDRGIIGTRAIGLMVLALAGCSPDAPAPANTSVANDAAPSPTPDAIVVPAAATASPLRDWVIGSWSFDTSCATDFIIHYEADGALDNAGEVGTWMLDGDMLTETVVERFENGGEAPVKLDPPVIRTYRIAQRDGNHGTIRIENRVVPILRC